MKPPTPQQTDPYIDPESYGDDLGGGCTVAFMTALLLWAVVLVALIVWTWPR